jgi:ParB/RepB/Spo0J family partition protein
VTERRRLLEPQELAELGPPEAVRLPVDLVDENPLNPRKNLAEVDALAANIRQFGLLQPVTVRRAGERYELLGGHRRRAAFLALTAAFPFEPQWKTIPAVVRTAADAEARLMLISGQVHNRAWTPREEASVLEELAVEHTLKQIGDMVHRGESWVSKRLRIYADSVLSGYVQSGTLQAAVAEELLLVPDPAQRREFAERAIADAWTVTHARAQVRTLKLDKQLREIGRRVNELVDLLSSIEPSRIPIDAFRDLQVLRGRIEMIGDSARGGPVFPSIEAAQAKAGVNPDRPAKRRQTRLRVD